MHQQEIAKSFMVEAGALLQLCKSWLATGSKACPLQALVASLPALLLLSA
jgi:hypothetical protein